MSRKVIHTERAPQAIGTYSQAVRVGDTVYLSGQTPLDPATQQMVSGGIEAEIVRVFENLKAVAEAAGGSLAQAVKVHIFSPTSANSPRSTKSWRAIFRSRIRRGPPSASRSCPKARA